MRLCFLLGIVLLSGSTSYNTKSKLRYSKDTSIEYFPRPNHHITIPVIIHFDRSLTDKLMKERRIKTRKKLKYISKLLLKEVETYFKHPSLNQSIHIALQDTKFIRKKGLTMDENGSEYLKSYCTRQEYMKRQSRKWWYSILLTGLDLYYVDKNGRKVRSSTGQGFMRGICAVAKSCTVIEWNPKNIGYLLAHEMGHSMGMAHDGPPHNGCRPHVNIMTSKYDPRYHPNTWSKCSKRDLQKFLLSKKAWCLR